MQQANLFIEEAKEAHTADGNATVRVNNEEGGKITMAMGDRQKDSQPGKDISKGMATDKGSDTREKKWRSRQEKMGRGRW